MEIYEYRVSKMEDEDYRVITVNDTILKCFSDGRIHRRCKSGNKYGKKGEWIKQVNKPNSRGYIQLSIGWKKYYVHRLILLAFAGESDQEVDHINRIKTDNRFQNLRYVTRRENILNMERIDKAKGYYWNKQRNKWHAQINIDNKLRYLGRFDTEEEARQVYLDACEKCRGV
jgi:hypothetical protein